MADPGLEIIRGYYFLSLRRPVSFIWHINKAYYDSIILLIIIFKIRLFTM